jgi:hypothetical protein
MFKLSLAAIAAAAVLALPAAHGSAPGPRPSSVSSSLLREMNSGPAGQITRRVTCTPSATRRGSHDCDLDSTISTHLTARADPVGGGLVPAWHPLAG